MSVRHAFTLDIDRPNALPSSSLNLLPFHLSRDGPAPVSIYFLPREPPIQPLTQTSAFVSDHAETSRTGAKRYPPGQIASFRGRRVQAHTVPLPVGYTGLVLSAPPTPTSATEDVPTAQASGSRKRVTRSAIVAQELDEGVAGLRRSPRKRRVPDEPSLDAIRPTKRVQRQVKKTAVVKKFSLDSDEEEDEDGYEDETPVETVIKPEPTETSGSASILQGSSLEVVETVIESIDTASTSAPSELPSSSIVPPASPTTATAPVAVDPPSPPADIADERPRAIRDLKSIASFDAFTLWTPDGPMEGDGARDEYVRSLTEWIELSRELHGC